MRHRTSRSSEAFRRVLVRLACVLLLFAQHVGLTHAIWHAAQQTPSKQQRVDEERRDGPSSRDVSKLCVLDALFGQVLGGGPLACHHVPAQTQTAETPAHAQHAFATLEALTPRSRGPPSPF